MRVTLSHSHRLTREDVAFLHEHGFTQAKVGNQITHLDTTRYCWDVNLTWVLVGALQTEFHPWREGDVKYCANPKRKGETSLHVGAGGEFGWENRARRGLAPAPLFQYNGKVLSKPRTPYAPSELATLFRSNHAHRGPHETVNQRLGGGRLVLFGALSPYEFRKGLSPMASHESKTHLCGFYQAGVLDAKPIASKK